MRKRQRKKNRKAFAKALRDAYIPVLKKIILTPTPILNKLLEGK